MKRYLLFAGEHYYPEGGWADFHQDFDSLREAEDKAATFGHGIDWWHIVDSQTKDRVVWMGDRRHGVERTIDTSDIPELTAEDFKRAKPRSERKDPTGGRCITCGGNGGYNIAFGENAGWRECSSCGGSGMRPTARLPGEDSNLRPPR